MLAFYLNQIHDLLLNKWSMAAKKPMNVCEKGLHMFITRYKMNYYQAFLGIPNPRNPQNPMEIFRLKMGWKWANYVLIANKTSIRPIFDHFRGILVIFEYSKMFFEYSKILFGYSVWGRKKKSKTSYIVAHQ